MKLHEYNKDGQEKGKKSIQDTLGIRRLEKSSSALEEKRFTTHSPHILVLLGL